MKCPHCGRKIEDPKQPFKPFCSERCKLIDLGKWISGEYRVPTLETDNNNDGDEDSKKDPGEE